jgi:glucose-1-phosphate cytidylyltransferase
MKAVILAGGLGTRLSEETRVTPKPLVEIGVEPILWHIMKIFSTHGVRDFIVCCGYKGYMIKQFFKDYRLRNSSVRFNLNDSSDEYLDYRGEDWSVTLLETGLETATGGRLKRAAPYLGDEPFFFTYGDGVGNMDLTSLRRFHASHGKLASVTAVQPTGRFGAMYLKGDDAQVDSFLEKPAGDGTWISGGFFVLDPRVIDLIEDDETIWEHLPMTTLASTGELMAYRHHGFWHPMDTMRDKVVLNKMWDEEQALWKIW